MKHSQTEISPNKATSGDPAGEQWRATASGFCAILVGIGLARFAYSPLIPALIEAGWFSAAQTAYLGAANLAGYLAGALLAGRMAERFTLMAALRAMMALAALSFFASALPLDFWWYTGWRLAAGIAGGALMVLGPPAALTRVPPHRHGLAGGIIFAGVGFGIVLSGTLVPPLLQAGLPETWLALGGLAALLALVAEPGWRGLRQSRAAHPTRAPRKRVPVPRDPVLLAMFVVYGLCAVGLVPHMVFLVDFVARGLGRGIGEGALIWVLFGLGAILGPLLIGHLADRIGLVRALRLGFLLQIAGIGLIAVVEDVWALALSSLIAGAFVPGNTALVLGRVRALFPGDLARQQATWGVATTAFAIGQAAAAYGFAALIDAGGAGYMLFAFGAGALGLALAVDLVASKPAAIQQPPGTVTDP